MGPAIQVLHTAHYLASTMTILGICYAAAAFYAFMKLRRLGAASGTDRLDSRRLFVLSLGASCIVRLGCFVVFG